MGLRSRSRSGLTLAEVTVASAVTIFVTFASTSLLVAGLASQSSQQSQSDMQRDVAGVLSRLSDELSESNAACVHIGTTPEGVVFASARDALGRFSYASDARLQWRGYVCYYVDQLNGTPCVFRKWSPLTAAVADPPAVPASMTTAWFQAQPLARQMMGAHITRFTISGSTPLLVSLTASQDERHRLDVSTRVFLRN